MKLLKKLVATALLVGMLSMGLAGSAFANVNIYEQNDVQNNNFWTPENFLAPLPPGYIPFGYTKLGTLSSPSDSDWYLLEIPASLTYPGSQALITLFSAYEASYYRFAITDEVGNPPEVQWLTDDGKIFQAVIKTKPNVKYKIRVYTDEDTVSPYYYMLSVD